MSQSVDAVVRWLRRWRRGVLSAEQPTIRGQLRLECVTGSNCQQQEIEGQLHRHYASFASLLPLQTETIAMVQSEATYFGVGITSRRPSPMGPTSAMNKLTTIINRTGEREKMADSTD